MSCLLNMSVLQFCCCYCTSLSQAVWYYGMCSGLHRVSLTLLLFCSAVYLFVACIQLQLCLSQTLTACFFLRRSQDTSSSMPAHTHTHKQVFVCQLFLCFLLDSLGIKFLGSFPKQNLNLLTNNMRTILLIFKKMGIQCFCSMMNSTKSYVLWNLLNW